MLAHRVFLIMKWVLVEKQLEFYYVNEKRNTMSDGQLLHLTKRTRYNKGDWEVDLMSLVSTWSNRYIPIWKEVTSFSACFIEHGNLTWNWFFSRSFWSYLNVNLLTPNGVSSIIFSIQRMIVHKISSLIVITDISEIRWDDIEFLIVIELND